MVNTLNKRDGVTVIMVSHDMNEVYENATRVIVFRDGSVAYDLPPRQLFRLEEEIVAMGLEVPHMAKFCNRLQGGIVLPDDALTTRQVCQALCQIKRNGGDEHVS